MPACNRLRIDGNGSSAVDYRIESGFVESRTLETNAPTRATLTTEKQWHRLTPEQLTSRVMADKLFAKWLLRRMGLHGLVRACYQGYSSPNNPFLESPSRTAA